MIGLNDGGTTEDEGLASHTLSDSTSRRTFKLPSSLQTIAISSSLAALAGISASLGMAFATGRKEALSLYALTSEAVDKRDVFIGLTLVVQVLVDGLFVVISARVAYLGIRWGLRKAGLNKRVGVLSLIKPYLWLLALLVVITEAVILIGFMMELGNSVDGILFKGFAEIGNVWSSVILEEAPHTVGRFTFLYSGLLATFIWLSWWLVSKGIDRPLRRIVVSTMGLLVVFATLWMFAYLSGAAATAKDYPVVALSNEKELFGDKAVSILLGQDDKMFAVLVVLTGPKPNDELHKMVVYIPRSEVKYMAVVRTASLYRLDKYDDLMRTEEQMKSNTH